MTDEAVKVNTRHTEYGRHENPTRYRSRVTTKINQIDRLINVNSTRSHLKMNVNINREVKVKCGPCRPINTE